jgi:hypothetical protein
MNKLILLLISILLSFLLISCSGQQGTAEKIGKEIDKSIDSGRKTADGIIEKTIEKIEEIGSVSEGTAEQAGKKIDEALEKTAEEIEAVGDALTEKAEAAK